MTNDYHFLLMSQQDFLQNEVLEEVLRERTSSYSLLNKKNDFWIIVSPKFLQNSEISSKIEQSNFYKQKKSIILSENFSNDSKFYVVIISLNKEFITWLSLRLGYFENLESLVPEKPITQNYTSTGIYGTVSNLRYKEGFNFEPNFIHPSILMNKYQKLVNSFYKENQKV